MMAEQAETAREYTMGYSAEFRQLLDRRSLQSHAKHLLPHLKPGMRALDFGCGPGTISVGLADAVHPGELHGIDMEASQIELARAAAESGGHSNATFHVGNVLELPFDDNFFDVAHCHAVLMHIPDTQAALTEVKRVLKPGGVLASRELIATSTLFEPSSDDLAEAFAVFCQLLEANGGHRDLGKELKRSFLSAGLNEIQATASFDFFSSHEDIKFLQAFISDWFFMPRVIAAAVQYGLATQEDFDRWRIAVDQWREEPGVVGGLAFGECVGRKPFS